MSVNKLNKVTGLTPEQQIIEDHHGPSKTLKETIATVKKIKSDLGDVEHYVEKLSSSPDGDGRMKKQLEEQLIRAKQEMVKLDILLAEQLRNQGEEPDEWVFDD